MRNAERRVLQGVVGVWLLLAVSLCAGEDYSGEMLSIGVGARALAMGGAFVAVANDASAAYWNPAGLSHVQTVELSTIHRAEGSHILTGIGYDFYNCAFNLQKYGVWAVSYLIYSVGDIPLTDANPMGGDKPYVEYGTFSAKENAMLVSTGKQVLPYLALGATTKILWNKYGTDTASAKASGLGFDLGFLLKPWRKFAVGGVVQDLGGVLKWSNTATNPTYTIPVNLKVGMSFCQRIVKHLVTVSFDIDTKYSPVLHYGAEYSYADLASLRLGLIDHGPSMNVDDKDVTAGLGVSCPGFPVVLDYAWVGYETVDAHFFSVGARF